jgi:alkanesulfonate monooxygenase SsuD/methylene tetrahydromethanopterin reductase-like flavin-dependent oxidoreductase (luciferase family)
MSVSARTGLRAGVLNRLYAPDGDSGVFASAIGLLEQAEALGLETAWVAQHHFGSETGQLPSPLLLLASASQSTRRIRLGTAVVVLPLERVLRLAEDAATLDVLSLGRLELGLGNGNDGPSFAAFGLDEEGRMGVYQERMALLGRILSGEPLVPGEAGIRLDPPGAALRGRLWEATTWVEGVAARGNGLITAPQPAGQPDASALIARYRAAWQVFGHPAAPRVALVRGIFPGADAASVEAEIGPDIARYLQSRGAPFSAADLADDLRALGVAWGSPAQIVDQLAAADGLAGVDQIVAQVQTFSTTHAQAARRLQIFAEHIVPALPAMPAAARGHA